MLHLISQIRQIYDEIDRQITTFQGASGLQCPIGCGKCCENPQVETTPLEVLPLALRLIQENKAEYWLNRGAIANYEGVCIFYQPDPIISGNGRCGVYADRPALCRLFGFGAVKTKHDHSELAACKIHKQTMPTVLASLALKPVLAPNFADFSMQLRNLTGDRHNFLVPINQAVTVAINKVGLILEYDSEHFTP